MWGAADVLPDAGRSVACYDESGLYEAVSGDPALCVSAVVTFCLPAC